MQKLAFLLSLLVTTVHGQSPMQGTWKSAMFGAIATLKSSNGTLTGTYNSSDGPLHGVYALVGSYHREQGRTTFAFSVSSATSNASMSWVGQMLSTPVLATQWLVVHYVDKETDLWQSTLTGVDVFGRV
jgi:hypothetical protein